MSAPAGLAPLPQAPLESAASGTGSGTPALLVSPQIPRPLRCGYIGLLPVAERREGPNSKADSFH